MTHQRADSSSYPEEQLAMLWGNGERGHVAKTPTMTAFCDHWLQRPWFIKHQANESHYVELRIYIGSLRTESCLSFDQTLYAELHTIWICKGTTMWLFSEVSYFATWIRLLWPTSPWFQNITYAHVCSKLHCSFTGKWICSILSTFFFPFLGDSRKKRPNLEWQDICFWTC